MGYNVLEPNQTCMFPETIDSSKNWNIKIFSAVIFHMGMHNVYFKNLKIEI